MLRHSSRIWLLNDSTYPLRYGEPGEMEDRPVRVPAQLDISSADELRRAVRSEHRRRAADGDEVLEVSGEPVGGDRLCGELADALLGVFVDDRADLDRRILLVGIELEVHRPHYVRRVRCGRVDARGSDAFASTLLWDAQVFVTSEVLDLLVVDDPALGARRDTPVGTRKACSQSRNARSGSVTVSTVSGRRYAKRERPTRRYAICSLTGTVLIR